MDKLFWSDLLGIAADVVPDFPLDEEEELAGVVKAQLQQVSERHPQEAKAVLLRYGLNGGKKTKYEVLGRIPFGASGNIVSAGYIQSLVVRGMNMLKHHSRMSAIRHSFFSLGCKRSKELSEHM